MDQSIWDTHTVLFNKQLIKENKKKALRNGETQIKKKETIQNFKMDEHNEIFKHKKIDKKISELIRDGRLSKNIKQKELAKSLNIPVKTINDYENGKSIPDNIILGKIEKKLNIKLRGKFKD